VLLREHDYDQIIMSERDDRWVEIASALAQWGSEAVDFVRRASQIQRMPTISTVHKQRLQNSIDKITNLSIVLGDMAASRPPDLLEQLIASREMICEHLASANQLLTLILSMQSKPVRPRPHWSGIPLDPAIFRLIPHGLAVSSPLYFPLRSGVAFSFPISPSANTAVPRPRSSSGSARNWMMGSAPCASPIRPSSDTR
jgi:hypothetical protein